MSPTETVIGIFLALICIAFIVTIGLRLRIIIAALMGFCIGLLVGMAIICAICGS